MRSRPPGGARSIALVVWAKELKEILRDSHALAYIVGFPVLFYPLLMWGLVQVAQVKAGQAQDEFPRIEIHGPHMPLEPLILEPARMEVGSLDEGDIDAEVTIVPRGDQLQVEIRYDSTRPRSERARDLIEERLPEVESRWLGLIARRDRLPPPELPEWLLESENVDPPSRMFAYVVSLALPGMLHLVLLLAALYPTVDVVVGERVRGTAETLLVSAAGRTQVILGKLLAVLSLTLAAVVANVGAMGVTLAHLVSLQGGAELLALDLTSGPLALAGLVCLGATGLVVAVMTLVVTPARSFKEGQGAGNLVVTAGGVLVVLGMLPLTSLSPVTALVPLANSVLVLRSALLGDLVPGLAWLALGELLLLTLIALRLAGRTLSRPDALLG